MGDLRLEEVSRMYGETCAVDRLSLDVRNGELLTLLGPSGSGKTTLLRMVAGYVTASAGVISIGGVRVNDLPPERRDVGMVFQSYALFPHLTVQRNVAFGLERRRLGRDEVSRRVRETLELVDLGGLHQRYPHELSGGQQQRVALARALVIRPRLLLLDEPMSNLDAALRQQVRIEIRRLQRELKTTTVWVTHDQEDALAVSDRIAVLRRGALQQVGTPSQIYGEPHSAFVASFIGRMNLLEATRESVDGAWASYRLETGDIVLAPVGPERAILGIRPDSISLGEPPPGEHANRLRGHLEYQSFEGEVVERAIDLGNTRLTCRTLARDATQAAPGSEQRAWWPVASTRTFAADSR